MQAKYSPCKSDKDTIIKPINPNLVQIDGIDYEFDTTSVSWPDIAEITNGVILEAHREGTELYLAIRRFYTVSCNEWDNGQYNEVVL